MWTPRALAVLISLLVVVPLAQAQLSKPPEPKAQDAAKAPDAKAPDPKAQDSKAPAAKTPAAKADDFRVEDVASLADSPIAQLKPKTIIFADHPPENLVDPGAGFMRYE